MEPPNCSSFVPIVEETAPAQGDHAEAARLPVFVPTGLDIDTFPQMIKSGIVPRCFDLGDNSVHVERRTDKFDTASSSFG
jgi:hypothetical protein